MRIPAPSSLFGATILIGAAILIGVNFTLAAVQGEFGVLRRVEITAELKQLVAERDRLTGEVARMENLTRRLSDGYLDLDLLDERARDVLGYLRADERVIP